MVYPRKDAPSGRLYIYGVQQKTAVTNHSITRNPFSVVRSLSWSTGYGLRLTIYLSTTLDFSSRAANILFNALK